MEKTIEQISQEVDSAMAGQDFETVIERAREILMRPVDSIGIDVFVRASIIFAYALIKLGRFEEAENVLQSLMKSGIGLVDTYFLLFCVAFEEKKTDKLIEYGEKFIDEIYGKDEIPASITTASSNRHEVINNLATTLLDSGDVTKACEVLDKGIELTDNFPLLYINLGIAFHRREMFGEAEKTLLSGIQKCEDKGELHRTLGLIYEENNFFLKAEMHFQKALDFNLFEAHMDLSIMFNKLSKIYDAEKEIQEYLKHNPGESLATKMLFDIRSLKFYGKPEEKISAAMIVKNEENMLEQCIESFREAVDEIIIVDTGSTDRTVEIAKNYNIDLYHHEWKDDFSEARNFSISKTTGDWVMIIDADEQLEREDITRVRALKWQDDFEALCFGVYSALPGDVGSTNFGKHYSPRFFRKKPYFYYYGIVHNILNIPGKAGVTNIRMYHLGYDLDPDKMDKKFERSIKLLLKQVQEKPDDPFTLMNTAQMYLSRNYYDEAEEYAKRCVDILEKETSDQEHLLLMGLYQLSLIYMRRQEYEKCEDFANRALARKDNYIDAMLSIGWCYFVRKKYDQAVEILERFLSEREKLLDNNEFNLIIISKLGCDYEANFLLGEIYKDQGDFEKAKENYRKSLESNSFYWNVYNSLGEILLKEGKFSEAADAFENAIKYGYLNAEKYGAERSFSTVYGETVENYKLAVEKDIKSQKSRPTVKNALGNIDALLDKDE